MRSAMKLFVVAPLLVGLAACSDSDSSPSATEAPATVAAENETTDAPEITEAVDTTDATETAPDETEANETTAFDFEYTNDVGQYSVLFPGAPSEASRPINDHTTAEEASFSIDTGSYVALYIDIQEQIVDPEAIVTNLLAASGSLMGIEDVTFTEYPYGDYPGWRAAGESADAQILGDGFLVGQRVYLVFFVGQAGLPLDDAEYFLSTIQVWE